ncbi:MAG: hypothetical protein AAF518_26105 [Spirochaetota bacterium]
MYLLITLTLLSFIYYFTLGWALLVLSLAILISTNILWQIYRHPGGWKGVYYKFYSYRYWEFWPANLFYIPVVFYYIYYLFYYRLAPNAISLVSPCFPYGGMSFDSKYKMLDIFTGHEEFLARTIYIGPDLLGRADAILGYAQQQGFHFPFVAKPDKGHRGNGFKVIRNQEQFISYVKRSQQAFLIQEYIDYPLEYGVFWVKVPGEVGSLISITRKKLAFLTGDGKSSLRELIWQDPRARLLSQVYLERNKSSLDTVLAEKETFYLGRAGNHCQGAIFEDGEGDLQQKSYEKLFQICNAVEGFDFGRMDIKFASPESLSNGKGFKIIEVNGSEAEFTHIYDKKYSIPYAYGELKRQWKLVFQIARKNKEMGMKPIPHHKLASLYWSFFRKEGEKILSD